MVRSAIPSLPSREGWQEVRPRSLRPVAGPNESSEWDPCPCGKWGVCRADRHGCVAMCKELFPQLDQELDAWEAEHGWLYR